jgi:hypothetical protein
MIVELLLLLIMLHGLSFILCSMPKYNKQLFSFQKKDNRLTLSLKYTGFILITLSALIAVVDKGIGVGIAWLCALLTLTGTFITICFSIAPNRTIKILLIAPDKLFKHQHNGPLVFVMFYIFFSVVFLDLN